MDCRTYGGPFVGVKLELVAHYLGAWSRGHHPRVNLKWIKFSRNHNRIGIFRVVYVVVERMMERKKEEKKI